MGKRTFVVAGVHRTPDPRRSLNPDRVTPKKAFEARAKPTELSRQPAPAAGSLRASDTASVRRTLHPSAISRMLANPYPTWRHLSLAILPFSALRACARGLSTRQTEALSRRDEMIALGHALDKALVELQREPAVDIVRSPPAPLLTGLDIGLLSDVLGRYRRALYPLNTTIDVAACERNVVVMRDLGLIGPNIAARPLLDLTIAGS